MIKAAIAAKVAVAISIINLVPAFHEAEVVSPDGALEHHHGKPGAQWPGAWRPRREHNVRAGLAIHFLCRVGTWG